jgi:hypothetical protein
MYRSIICDSDSSRRNLPFRVKSRGIGVIQSYDHSIREKQREQLKETLTRDFCTRFFLNQNSSHNPLIHTLKPFRVLMKKNLKQNFSCQCPFK